MDAELAGGVMRLRLSDFLEEAGVQGLGTGAEASVMTVSAAASTNELFG